MGLRTIEAYGYTVTGTNEIISQIEEWKSDSKNGINWNNYNENSLFWDLQGMIGYRMHIDHVKKTVVLVHWMETIKIK